MLPVGDQIPVAGSKISAELKTLPQRFPPPARRTFPSLKSVAVAPVRAKEALPEKLHVPVVEGS